MTRASERVSNVRREMEVLLVELKVGGKGRLRGWMRCDGWDPVKHLSGD